MRIDEVDQGADPKKLLGLVDFLAGRANDTDSRKGIDRATLITLANDLGIAVTDQTLPAMISQPPLNGVLEPINPKEPNTVFYKGADIGPAKMSVPQAQQVVNKMAKSAMKRGMK